MKRRTFLIFAFTFLLTTFLSVQSVAPEWSDDKPLITLSLFDGASSIIQTSDQRVWIVWQRDTLYDGYAIFYATSSNYGASWSQKQSLTNLYSTDINVDPAITQLSNDTIWVVWSALKNPPLPGADFTMSASPESLSISQGDSGTSTITVTSVKAFGDPVNLTVKSILPPFQNINASLNPEQVIPPPNGEADSILTIDVGADAERADYTITVQGYSERLDITSDVAVALTVTQGSAPSASSTKDTNDTPPSTYSSSQSVENYEIYYKTSNDNGTSWSNEVKLTEDSADDFSPFVLQASNGTIWTVWSSYRIGANNSEIFYKTSSDFGASWSNDTRLTFENSTDSRPAIAQMDDGRIWIAWHSLRYGNEEILYRIYNGSWSSTFRLTNHTNMDNCPAILQTANGTIHIFWASSGTTDVDTFDVYRKESHNNGENWSDRIQFTTDTISDDIWPAVAESLDTRIWVTWTTNRTGNWDIYYRTSSVHNIAVTNITPSETQVYQEENVTVDVTVQNYGDYNETFTVNCYTNSTPIGSQGVNLVAQASDVVTFTWNTTSFPRGDYLLKANASSVDGETYTGDNTLTHENVRVKLLGDVDDNGIVDISDLHALSAAYDSVPQSPNWNKEADMNGDNEVNDLDLSALIQKYSKTE